MSVEKYVYCSTNGEASLFLTVLQPNKFFYHALAIYQTKIMISSEKWMSIVELCRPQVSSFKGWPDIPIIVRCW